MCVSGVLDTCPQQVLELWDMWMAWESLPPLQVSQVPGAEAAIQLRGSSPDSCPIPSLSLPCSQQRRAGGQLEGRHRKPPGDTGILRDPACGAG